MTPRSSAVTSGPTDRPRCTLLTEDADPGGTRMRPLPLALTVLLTLSVAYYVYTPIPDDIQEPWKLMLVDAALRTAMHLVRDAMNYYHHDLFIGYVTGAAAYRQQRHGL